VFLSRALVPPLWKLYYADLGRALYARSLDSIRSHSSLTDFNYVTRSSSSCSSVMPLSFLSIGLY